MSTNSNNFRLTSANVQQMIASRGLIKSSQVGDTKRFHIRGDGFTIPVTTKDGAQVMASGTDNIPLMKTIYNVKANSHIAMINPRNQEILRTAVAAEEQGDNDAAHEAFNDYLNKIQVSFSVILNPGRKVVTFYDKQLVEGEIELITTDNGQLLTITNPRTVKIDKVDATPKFSLNDLLGLVEAPTAETVFAPIDGATAPVPTKETE